MSKRVGPRKRKIVTKEVMKKFWANVEKQDGDDACWIWVGTTRKYKGKGQTTRAVLHANGHGYSPYLLAVVGVSGCIPSDVSSRHYTCKNGNQCNFGKNSLTLEEWVIQCRKVIEKLTI